MTIQVRAGPTVRDQLVEDREGDPGADHAEHDHRGDRAEARDDSRSADHGRPAASSTVLATITQAATPIGGTSASRCLTRSPPIA